MKESKQYSGKLLKLYRALKRAYPKVEKPVYEEVTDALVYAIVSENISESATQSAIKRFGDYFIDLNDLRVSREEEIVELLKSDTPATRTVAFEITRALRAVFDKYNTVSLEDLRKIGKRPAKQVLEKIEESAFVVNYIMLTALQAHAIPLTEKMIEYLRKNELVHPGADEQAIEGFLTRQIPVRNAYEFYALLRLESEVRQETKKRTSTSKRKRTRKGRKKAK